MKAVSEWFWLVAGIIGGLIIFTLAYQQIAEINKKNVEQRNLGQFTEIKNIIDNLCKSFAGNRREYSVSLSETVEGIYVAPSKYEEYGTVELVEKILKKEYGNGNYLCIKIKNKKLECEELNCNTNMPFMGAVPEKFSLSALVNNLMGRGKVFDYPLEFERRENNVFVEFTDR